MNTSIPISERWRAYSKRTRRIITGGTIVMPLLILWLAWPFISAWRAGRAYEADRITTDATSAQALKEAQETKGQLQQLQQDFNALKGDYERTKEQITQLETDLAAARQNSQRATVVYQQARERQKAFVPRRDAGSLSDDALRRDASAAERAVKP